MPPGRRWEPRVGDIAPASSETLCGRRSSLLSQVDLEDPTIHSEPGLKAEVEDGTHMLFTDSMSPYVPSSLTSSHASHDLLGLWVGVLAMRPQMGPEDFAPAQAMSRV